MNCIIVDDDETSRFVLSNLVKKIEDLHLVGSCINTQEAKEILKNKEVDLILLDIEMPGETGIEMFEKMTGNIEVVFVTSQTKHAVSAFENDAVDYILKPIDLSRLNKAIEKVRRRLSSTTQDVSNEAFLFVRGSTSFEKVFLKDILFIESTNGYVTFQTTYKKITMSGTLKKVMDKIEAPEFIQAHRSYVINLHKVTKYEADKITVGSTDLPLSRLYKKDIINELNKLAL